MFNQYSTDQLYALHAHLTQAAQCLHRAWATHLKATGDLDTATGDMSTAVAAMAAPVYDELKRRHDAAESAAATA